MTTQDLHWEPKPRSPEPSARRSAPGLSTVYCTLAILADRKVLHCFHRDAEMAYRLRARSRPITWCAGAVDRSGNIAVANRSRLIHHQLSTRSPSSSAADQGVVSSSPYHATLAAPHG